MRHSLLSALVAFALACATGPSTPPPVDGGAGDCAAAADNLMRMQCTQEVCAQSDCDTFAERCLSIESDIPDYLNTPCLARAVSCDAARACADE
jgi:hypothetical protein